MPSSSQSPRGQNANDAAQIFDAEALGASFQHLAIDVVRGERTDFTSRWFRARNGDADLVIWTDGEKRIIKHQLCFFGQVVEWTPIHGTRTGFVIEEELIGGAASSDSPEVAEHIRFDQQIQGCVVVQAVSLLSHVPQLSDSDRSAMIFNLRQSPRLHKKARDRALQVWAPKIDEIDSSRRPTFWKRLRNWVLGG